MSAPQALSLTKTNTGSAGRTKLNRSQLARLRRKVRRISAVLERNLGVPRRKSEKPRPLDMLVATILSQNTNDKNSHRAYTELRRRFPSWESLAEASLSSIRSVIRSGGMANQKSVRIRDILLTVRHRFGRYSLATLERLTDDEVIDQLVALHGVGVKTAACVLLFSLGRDVFPVDTHVFRVCSRLGLTPGSKAPDDTFFRMRPLVPRGKSHTLHTNMIRFGRRICRSAVPRCGICPLYGDCVYEGKKRAIRNSPSPADHDFMLLDNV